MLNEFAGFQNCKSIAIMGGTFDPIHNGHLVTAEAVRHRFNVDKVIFIPTGRPAHKMNQTVTHHEHRYLMTVLATMRNDNFDVSRIEIDREGTTYTIDTITELKKICRPDVRLYFITGADAIHQIMHWKEPERLMSLCDFVAVTRPGYDKKKLLSDIKNIKEKFPSRIHFMEVPALAISSSDIRMRAKEDAPIKYLLPQAVVDYIHKFELYQNEEDLDMSNTINLESMKEKLQSALQIKRYIHTLGVESEAMKLAEIYGTKQDKQKAQIAGLLHDCAKDYPRDLQQRLCKEYKLALDEDTIRTPQLIHAVLGAEIAKREYQITDTTILDAIRYHTTGRPHMSLLEKIIYIADYIEPNREKFDGIEEARRLAYLDLDLAMCFILADTINYVKEQGRKPHPISEEALQYYKQYQEDSNE
ncbi:nicotinate-nucleotide adenylyltransferase [Chakrabartyella piscis]|uniref:nicotinate-nucleotide adenylyltransferase n=1 Tax=Chakrabartyella piscis TaxID=2918914 RepID=UPI0029583414|nr:nicotinate-nucleotide adenylyltransferase [Chakrabartyella piscis]